MNELIPMREGTELETRGCDALKNRAWENALSPGRQASRGTPVKVWANRNVSGETSPGNPTEPAKNSKLSRCAAIYGRRDRLIRENIIGHRRHATRRIAELRFARMRRILNPRRAFALFHEPSREHGGGVFIQPRIEQLANLLAEIGGVTQPREFVALERISRSRQKELPWRLRLLGGHRCLPRRSWQLP
jgi:hypothetical protein